MIDPKKIAEWSDALRPETLGRSGPGSRFIVLAIEAIPTLLAEREEMLALLREVEEEADGVAIGRTCSYCRRIAKRLAAFLKE